MIQVDTVTRYDTIRIHDPGETRFEKLTETLILPKVDTLRLRDTIYLVVNREIKEYRDSLYFAKVSGYQPSLDYIEVYPKTVVISKTEITNPKSSPWNMSLDVGLDYSRIDTKYISPKIGAEIGYKRFSVTAELGVNLRMENMTVLEPYPYWQIGVKYSLFRR